MMRMKKFYFVGGPKEGCLEEFFTRLKTIGGPPPGWRIYPHANSDGRALHVIDATQIDDIMKHLNRFSEIYDRGDIIEIDEK